MDNKLFYTCLFIALLLGNVTGFAQDGGCPPGAKSTLKASAETFYDGDQSDIWSFGSIIATNTVHAGARVNYKATNSIKFTTGFKAVKGSSVTARLGAPDISGQTGTGEENILEGSGLITVYPNPSNGIFKIGTNGLDFPVPVNVYDYTGKVILNREIEQGLEQIDLTSCPKGIYIIKINVAGKAYTNKVTLL